MIKMKHRLQSFPDKCRFCQTCVLACSMIHENGRSSISKARLSITRKITDNKVTITICRHCNNPKCISDCPTNAMHIDRNGIVIIDEERCNACGNCQKNCPFGAIIFIKEKNTYQKCDLCHNLSEGPLCVEVCPVNALILKAIKE